MSEFGLETLALLIGPKRTFHIALGWTGTKEKVESAQQIHFSCSLAPRNQGTIFGVGLGAFLSPSVVS